MGDYSVGEGTTTFQKTISKFQINATFSHQQVGTSLWTDHIISAISSLVLQLHLDSEYLVFLHSSSWTNLMWRWKANLNCRIFDRSKHIIGDSKCIRLVVT